MYSRRESDGLMVRLFTEDFTLESWCGEDGMKGEISGSAVIIDYDNKVIIRTCANFRAVTYWNSWPITSKCICVPDYIFHEIRNMLPVSSCYYIPHSDQLKIMRLLGTVLY